MSMFRELKSEEEKKPFRTWARQHYTPGEPINELWHPVTRKECRKMNQEAGVEINEPQFENFDQIGDTIQDMLTWMETQGYRKRHGKITPLYKALKRAKLEHREYHL